MNKAVILSLLVCMAMLLTGCAKSAQTPTTGEELPTQTQSATETIPPTTEQTLPGVVNNPFDDDASGEDTSAGNVQTEETTSGDSASETTTVTEPPYEESTPEDSQAGESTGEMTYEKYNSMSGEDQMAFFATFDSAEDFVAWYNAAREKYEEEHPPIEIENGEIDLDSIFGGN